MASAASRAAVSSSRSCSVEECKNTQYKNAYCLDHYRAYVHSGQLAPQTSPIPKTVGKVVFVSERCPVVLINHSDLVGKKDLSLQFNKAFGVEGNGMIAIAGVPGYANARTALLPLAHRLMTSPSSVKSSLEVKAADYQVGWNDGHDVLYGKPDTRRAVFAANPLFDTPYEQFAAAKKFPLFSTPNVWSRDIPELERAFKGMGQILYDTGVLLAAEMDEYCKSRLGVTYMQTSRVGRLTNIMKTSRSHRGQLIYYKPLATTGTTTGVADNAADERSPEQKEYDIGSWHHWHNDISSITGVVGGMYIDSEGKEIEEPDSSDHTSATGIYVKTRGEGGDNRERVIHLPIPSEYVIFRVGETMQIHSGGALQSAPHALRAPPHRDHSSIGRIGFEVQFQPSPEEGVSVPLSLDSAKVLEGTHGKFLTLNQPSLEKRWKESKDFHLFVDNTRKHYAAVPLTKLEHFEGLGTSGASTTSVAGSTSSSYPALSSGIATPVAAGVRKFAAPKAASSSSAAGGKSCNGCGSKLSDVTAKFCSSCGRAVA